MSANHPLQEAPLPRYRFNEETGKWKKEAGRTEKRTDGSVAEEQPFESSYDYFLRRSYAVQNTETGNEKNNLERDHTIGQIETFKTNHFPGKNEQLFKKKRTGSEDSEGEGPSFDVNPIIGYLNSVSLGHLFNALVVIKGSVNPPSVTLDTSAADLSLDDFHEVLSLVGNTDLLSKEYEARMFQGFADLSSTGTVSPYDVFTYVVDHTYHPRLDLTAEMLFFAFDLDKRHVIPVEALHPRVVEAWAEENTFGNLRENWMKFGEALRCEADLGKHIVGDHTLLDPPTVRAVLASSDALFAIANAVDLEGSGGKKKKAN
ncbi:hypothetical protein STCU_05416 [Strigomonas culicis]|uniref:EF-hand domain-containing protein n=1 Tax=Strigomonas culicis TaxID=28005 RepID=S9UAV1_9TRYP|nr:hypothetical protein STCU_05416 [Strigomonas culicis]|eukprot:EPY27922.1 hypothetical protein STCU_05416 [Strigomonas culicis]